MDLLAYFYELPVVLILFFNHTFNGRDKPKRALKLDIIFGCNIPPFMF